MKLPFKENHAVLPDNFMLSQNRLLELKSRLDEVEHDKIMKEELKASVIEEVNDNGTLGTITQNFVSFLMHQRRKDITQV